MLITNDRCCVLRFPLPDPWPVLILSGILWFGFDWLSEVWPTFGIPFRQVFHNAHDHFIGHTVFFFIIGMLILSMVPVLSRRLHWSCVGSDPGSIGARSGGGIFSVVSFQRSLISMLFAGDALGGMSAWLLWFAVQFLLGYMKKKSAAKSLSNANSD